MNELKVFENCEFGTLRGVEIDGESWLVGKDVAERLGYSNASKAVMVHVDDEDKQFEMLPVSDSQIGNLVKTALINESGLYSLVLGSKLPNAKKFKRWVTSEVLPAIRKHGGYLTAEKVEEALLNPDVLIRLATELKDEREARRALESKVAEDAPKVLFAKAVEQAENSILVGDLAKLIKQNGTDIGQKRLFARLREEGYLGKTGASYNMPTQRAMEMQLFHISERTINNPDGSVRLTRTVKVTGKGQVYFINRYAGGDRA
nr:MAG TPA: repressor domain protein [Caudoviricetes sp.]